MACVGIGIEDPTPFNEGLWRRGPRRHLDVGELSGGRRVDEGGFREYHGAASWEAENGVDFADSGPKTGKTG
jgi:hypothetical protein